VAMPCLELEVDQFFVVAIYALFGAGDRLVFGVGGIVVAMQQKDKLRW
jgi:hypothetical protein